MGDVFSQNNQIVLLQIFIFILHHYFNSFWYSNTHSHSWIRHLVSLQRKKESYFATCWQQPKVTPYSGSLRRRKGAYLACLSLLYGQRPWLLDCQPELRRVHSSTHPKESTCKNETFNRQGIFTLLNMCQWKGIITVTARLIKTAIWV